MSSPQDTVSFRLWPPVAIGWALLLLFVGWNGWSLWLFGRHQTGLLPGQATNAMI